jgi:hypothetical protein
MKRTELFLLLLIMGSLWGFVEMLPIPVFVLCAFGVLFLVIGRRLVDIPGTSILIGLIVCFYKAYSAHFFACQWAGVMALAVSFDFFTSVVFKENWHVKPNPILIGSLTNVLAMILFIVTVTFIFTEPNWVAGGFARPMRYALRTALPAALISGLISAPLGVLIGNKLGEIKFPQQRTVVMGFYAIIIAFLWIVA